MFKIVSKWGFQVRASFGKIDTQNLCVCEREEREEMEREGENGRESGRKIMERWCEGEVGMREIGKERKEYQRRLFKGKREREREIGRE